jgi:hypothetical protein
MNVFPFDFIDNLIKAGNLEGVIILQLCNKLPPVIQFCNAKKPASFQHLADARTHNVAGQNCLMMSST